MIYVVKLVHTWTTNDGVEQKFDFVTEVEWGKNSGQDEVVQLAIEDFYEEGFALYESGQLRVESIQEIETEIDREENGDSYIINHVFGIEDNKSKTVKNPFGKWYKPQFYFRTDKSLITDPINIEKLKAISKPIVQNEELQSHISSSIERLEKQAQKHYEEQEFLRNTADVIYEKIDDNIYKQIKNRSGRKDGFYSANQVIYDLNMCKVLIREPHTHKTIFANFYKYI